MRVTQHLTDIHLQVLTYLSLLGETTLDELAHVSELPESDCEAELMDMAAAGTAKWGQGPDAWVVTDAGRAEHVRGVTAETEQLGLRPLVQETHDVVAAWADDHAAVQAATEKLAARMRRFAGYAHRLAAASAGQGPKTWDRVVGLLRADLALTLGTATA